MSQEKFERAVEIIGGLPKDGPVKPTTDDQLYFYKYYKQATVGDNTAARPGLLDFTGKAKWDAWTSVKGVSKEECYKNYIEKLVELLKVAGDDNSKTLAAELEA